MNLYAYVFNNPTNRADPLGLDGAGDDGGDAEIECNENPPLLGGRKDPDGATVDPTPWPAGIGFQLATNLDIDVGLLDFCRAVAKRGGRFGAALLLACELALGARRPPPPPPPPRREVPIEPPKGPNRPGPGISAIHVLCLSRLDLGQEG